MEAQTAVQAPLLEYQPMEVREVVIRIMIILRVVCPTMAAVQEEQVVLEAPQGDQQI